MKKTIDTYWPILSSLLIICIMLALQGCSSGTTSFNTELGGVETMSTDMGRMTAWSVVETEKVRAVKAIETSQNRQYAPDVKVVLDTPEKIQAWTQYQTTAALKDAVVEMARALRPRSKALEPTAMPKGAFAEGVDSATGLVGAVVNSPVGVASSVGYFLGGVAKGAGTKITATEGSEVTVNQVAAKGTSTASVDQSVSTTEVTDMSDHSVGPVTNTTTNNSNNPSDNSDNSNNSDNSDNTNNSDNSDNSDNSNNSDNSDNSDNSNNSDNSTTTENPTVVPDPPIAPATTGLRSRPVIGPTIINGPPTRPITPQNQG